MNKLLSLVVLTALTGCCSFSQLGRDGGAVRTNGRVPVATYEVVNVSYKLLWFIPLSTGTTWKTGPYSEDVGSMRMFDEVCNLDDNLKSVRHACEVVGGNDIINVTGRVDDYFAWSLFLVKKRVVKTSCVIVR